MGVSTTNIINQFCRTLRTWKYLSKDHRDYILMKEVYHCTPSELYKQDENVLNMNYQMLMKEREREKIENERAKQRSKNSNHK